MKSTPILFSAPMILALLNGSKTQTRRIVKHIPALGEPDEWCHKAERAQFAEMVGDYRRFCPYGQPGDRLIVKEEHHITLRDARSVSVRYLADNFVMPEITIGQHEYDLFMSRKRPQATTRARFMWNCLSRITLELTAVRIERLQDISEADAKAEGVTEPKFSMGLAQSLIGGKDYNVPVSLRGGYCCLWNEINRGTKFQWSHNPWCWVLEFRRITP